MKQNPSSVADLKEALEGAKHTQGELDRQIFYLKALHDTTRELSYGINTRQAMESLLLMSMGTLGIASGFVLLIDTEEQRGELVSRGLEHHLVHNITREVPVLTAHFFPRSSSPERQVPQEAQLISPEEADEIVLRPLNLRVLMRWIVNGRYVGLMGFGERLLIDSYGNQELELLLSLANNLIAAIHNALSVQTIRQLNFDLGKRNEELREALRKTETTQTRLDRRVFHLKTLYDTTRELSNLSDTPELAQTFLLMVMGTFSVRDGFILLFDTKTGTGHLACRSLDRPPPKALTPEEMEQIIMPLLTAATPSGMPLLSAMRVRDIRLLHHQALPVSAQTGIFMVVDESYVGVVGLGNKITEESFSEDEQELLLTLTGNLTISLGNARAFQVIRNLNTELGETNQNLRKTIKELKASRLKIEMLEKAKARIRSLVQSEKERIGRVMPVDFVLILGVGILLGLIFNAANPNGIRLLPASWSRAASPAVNIVEAGQSHKEGASLFVDARPPEFFQQSHIRGAVNLPMALFDFVYMMKLSKFDPAKEIIVYGRNISRLYDEDVAFKLASRGHKNVKVLRDGLPAWKEKGYPTEP